MRCPATYISCVHSSAANFFSGATPWIHVSTYPEGSCARATRAMTSSSHESNARVRVRARAISQATASITS